MSDRHKLYGSLVCGSWRCTCGATMNRDTGGGNVGKCSGDKNCPRWLAGREVFDALYGPIMEIWSKA